MNAMPNWNQDHAAPLRGDRLSKSYDGKTVLRDVDFVLPEGTVLGLIGRNGAGKSTLIRILMGLIEADSGAATVLGEPALAMSDATKEVLGYVPQQPDALGWLRVDEMFALVRPFYPRWDQDFRRPRIPNCGGEQTLRIVQHPEWSGFPRAPRVPPEDEAEDAPIPSSGRGSHRTRENDAQGIAVVIGKRLPVLVEMFVDAIRVIASESVNDHLCDADGAVEPDAVAGHVCRR